MIIIQALLQVLASSNTWQNALQFAAGNYVEAASQGSQQLKQGEVRIRLHRITDGVRDVAERAVEDPVTLSDRVLRIDVERRVELVRQFDERGFFAAQFAVAIGESRRTSFRNFSRSFHFDLGSTLRATTVWSS